MSFSLKRQLFLLCTGFLFILGGVATLFYVNSARLMDQFDHVARTLLPAVRSMTMADMMHDGLRAVVLDALLNSQSGDQKVLENIKAEVDEKSKAFEEYIAALDRLPLNPETQKAIAETKPAMNNYIAQTRKIVELASQQGYAVASVEKPQFEISFKNLEVKMEELGDLIEKDAASAHDSVEHFRLLTMVIAGVGAFACVLCLASGYWITRGLVRRMSLFSKRVENTVVSLEDTSKQLSKVGQAIAEGASNAAASIEETVASLEELSSMVKLTSQNAQSASELSTKNFESSTVGSKSVQVLTQSMDQVKNSSSKIEEVINVIDDIAFQTNLLALNAAVEAARAGEQGKGFAVVADAVRSLAQRSADSAKDISKMIHESSIRVQEGNEAAHTSVTLLEEFLNTSQQLRTINEEIAHATREQSGGISQINNAISDIDKSSQNNAQAALEMSNTTEQMTKLSEDMQVLATELRLIVG